MEVLLYLVVASGAAAYLGYAVYARARRVRRLKARIASFSWQAIAAVQEGRAAVQGLARAGDLLLAPLSGKQVIGFRVKVEQLQNSGRGSRWETVVDISEVNPFQVQDSTGIAWVRPSFSALMLVVETEQTNGFFTSAPPQLEELLQRHGETTRGWLFEKKLRWSEFLLEPGERVFVGGHARRELDPSQQAAGYREAPRRLVIEAPDDGPMIIADSLRPDLIASLNVTSDLPPSIKDGG